MMVSPACAGMIPSHHLYVTPNRGEPRMRGDDPSSNEDMVRLNE